MTWVDDELEFTSLWAEELRLYIDGRHVTRFRGVEVLWQSYQLQEPYSYGPAAFRFPQISQHEHRSDEDNQPADLRWLRKRARVKLKAVVGGVLQPAHWEGFISIVTAVDGAIEITCPGEASGRLALNVQPPQLFQARRDAGTLVFEAFRDTYIRFTPRRGPDTGIVLDKRGGFEDMQSYVNSLLADTQELDGTQWTVRKHATKNAYEMVQKDLETTHCTVFSATKGVTLRLSDDLSEQPNTLYGSGIDPEDGHKWANGVVPSVVDDDAVPYPMAGGASFGVGTVNADTLTGDGISVMHAKLIATGFMKRDEGDGEYDAETEDAVEALQERRGLPVTGIMDPDTWDALYNVTATETWSLRGATILPLAQNTGVRKWDRTADGNIAQINPDFDPKNIIVARFVAHELLKKRRARRWSRREINRLAGKNWVGEIVLDGADVFEGEHAHEDPASILSRFQLEAGWNVWVPDFDGGTLFHIAGISITGDKRVSLLVDTQARDLRTVAEIVARNRESRRNRGRDWKNEHRTSGAVHNAIVGWFEQGGINDRARPVTAGRWKVFPVVGGQEGTVAKIRLMVPDCEYAVAVFGEKVTSQWLHAHIGDPFAVDEDGNSVWMTTEQTEKLFDQRTLLYAAGTTEEPCGYHPLHHTNPTTGGTTSAPVTGEHVDDGGFPYRCYGQPVLWVCVYSLQDGQVNRGRIMWQQIEEGT